MGVSPATSGPALAELLKRHRQACGLSQEELAERAGVSVRTICSIERGRGIRPYRKTVGLLAAALGIHGEQHAEFLRVARGAGSVGPSAERPYPRQLPAPLPRFAGRAAELKALDELLGRARESPGAGGALGGPAIAVISGAAGIGKSTLAVYWAHQVAGDFPDGQLYLNLRGFDGSGKKVTPAEAIRILLDGLRVPSEQVRELLAGRLGREPVSSQPAAVDEIIR